MIGLRRLKIEPLFESPDMTIRTDSRAGEPNVRLRVYRLLAGIGIATLASGSADAESLFLRIRPNGTPLPVVETLANPDGERAFHARPSGFVEINSGFPMGETVRSVASGRLGYVVRHVPDRDDDRPHGRGYGHRDGDPDRHVSARSGRRGGITEILGPFAAADSPVYVAPPVHKDPFAD
ncbi:hypothetical protein [Methylobacterium nonmethylotrophicum]|uniref:Uncharacterized protein n=1 Tax=Methylobacterium nonmethylotrophicum TaxID=1141884 RepID=A0A4Z0NGG6_9HYPH|nr:hypothetical protein [Methylobacterium nonmethylotrophicum]TGD95053.1 hypothetical protein EU555_29865 [Methylobacterium nonmethylotrophicum]